MARHRPQHSLCKIQIACEGEYVKSDRGMCGWCEQALARRNRAKKREAAPLRGEHYCAAEAAKGKRNES